MVLDLQEKIPEENIFFLYTHANTDTMHMLNKTEQLYTMDVPDDVYIGDVTKSGCSIKVLPAQVDEHWIDCIRRYGLNSFINPKESPTDDSCNYIKQAGEYNQADYWQDFKLYNPRDEYFNLALQFPLQYRALGEIYQGEREDSGLWGIYNIKGERLDGISTIFEEDYAAGKYGKDRVYPRRERQGAKRFKAAAGVGKRPRDEPPVRDSPRGSLELSVFIEAFKKYQKIKGPMFLFLISCRPLDTAASHGDIEKMEQEIYRIEKDGYDRTGRESRAHLRSSTSTIPERRQQNRKRRRGRGGYAPQRSRRTARKRVSKKNKKKKRKTIQLKRRRRKSKN